MSINFRGVKIIEEDAEVLTDIEKKINRQLNPVITIEYSVVGFKTERNRVVALGLYGCKLKQLPDNLFLLTSLEMLNLWDNEVSILPPSIGKLKSLVWLNLEKNFLTELPEELFSLPLQKLFLGDNQLKELPTAISQFKDTLIYLNLNRNKISSLPDELFTLVSLKTLGLSYNLITKLPKAIGQLVSLEKLTIEGLSLRKLPRALKSLPMLKELYQ